MMIDDLNISVVVEHGYPHYKIVDLKNGGEIHCDLNELDETIEELLEEESIIH